MRQDRGLFPAVAVPEYIPTDADTDDLYLDSQSLGLLRELRLKRFARGTGSVAIAVDPTGLVTVTECEP